MLTHLQTCQLCGGDRFIGLDVAFKDDPFVPKEVAATLGWTLCTQCSFLFQNPRRSREKQEEYYSDSEYRKTGPTPIPEGCIRYSPHQMARFAYWFAVCGIDLRAATGWTCLDYGCGIGGALDFLAGQGNDVYGVELDRTLAQFGNSHFRTRIKPRVSDLPAGLMFDLIWSHHSLEHVYDPNEFFAFARERLKPGGLLINVIPTWRYSNTSESLREFNSSHNCMYDHVSFAGFLNKHGFFMESHLYHNQAPDGDWEVCTVARKSQRKNYFSFNIQETLAELFDHIPKREGERKDVRVPENAAVVYGKA
jgi:SAM-dependent methyltransferase